jgi:uncharacterized protein (UPF0261 family)
VNKGYNTNDFVAYMQSQREDGEDIDNWSFMSLQDVVDDFKALCADQGHEEDDYTQQPKHSNSSKNEVYRKISKTAEGQKKFEIAMAEATLEKQKLTVI